MCNKYKFSRAYFSNILKVLKGSFREACDVYGFIKYNPTITLRLPRMEDYRNDIKHVYTQEEKQKISKALKGKPKSAQHIENMRKTRLGRKVSIETRKKMSEAQKRAWAKRKGE